MTDTRGQLLIAALVLFLGACAITNTPQTTIQAVSCERSAVGAAHDQARDGDTIVIPAGACTWTKTLSINKIVTVQGAGIDKTVLIHAVPWTDGQTQLLILNTKPGGITRLPGVRLDGGAGDVDPKKRGILTISGKSKTWRIDSIRFKITRTWGLVFNMDGYGVIDHNRFEVTGWGLTGITGLHSS